MRERPLVSIVTASYNQGRFIEETLRSVKEQDYPRLEHIVIDGASPDDTLQVLRRYEGTYDMRWISEPDQGHADALWKGFERAQGQVLAWLNSDDVYLPGAVSAAVDAFERYPEADLIYGDVLIIDERGRTTGERKLTRMDLYDFLGHGDCLAQPATFWRRHIYERVGGIDRDYYFQMDLDFFIRVALAGRLRHIRRTLAKMRMHAEGKMVKAEHIRRIELERLRHRYLKSAPLDRVLMNRQWLLARLFIRHALEGQLAYAGRKAWRQLTTGELFGGERR